MTLLFFFLPIAFKSAGQKESIFTPFWRPTYSRTEALCLIRLYYSRLPNLCLFFLQTDHQRARTCQRENAASILRQIRNWYSGFHLKYATWQGNLFPAAGDVISLLPFCQAEQAVKGREVHSGDQWTAKQMTCIRARVPVNFPWTRENRWSMASSLLFVSSTGTSSSTCNFSFCLFPQLSPTPQNQLNAVAVHELKWLASRCHSPVPLGCLPIVWGFRSEGKQFISRHAGWPIGADWDRSQAIGLIYPLCLGSKLEWNT